MTADSGLAPYDLTAPLKLLVPRYSPPPNPFTPEGRAEIARRRAEIEARDARNRELLDAALDDWLAACRRLVGNVPAWRVLAIHRPVESSSGPVCAHCREDSYDEAEPVPWTCATYRAVTEA